MPFTEYITDTQILAKIDEDTLGKLANRGDGKSWSKTVTDDIKKDVASFFESYAVNKWTLTQLRVDPPPRFAIKHNLNMFLYEVYLRNKQHRVPIEVEKEYIRTLKVLEKWGDPQIIDANGVAIIASTTGAVLYNKSESDLEFTKEDQEGMWG